MIWVVGNKGMLGSELSRTFAQAGIAFVGSDREIDFLDPITIRKFSELNHITGIVNCAGYTAVDKAEDEPELCRKLNVDGPANLASLASELGLKFVHISTDYVFAGDASSPYREEDTVNPQSIYGKTKAEGESQVLGIYPQSIIVRTAWLYGEFGSNFVYTMLKLMNSREEIGVVGDQIGSPTWTRDLAEALLMILQDTGKHSGIYHFTNEGITNWHAFATAIYEEGINAHIIIKPCRIKKLTTAEYPTKAKRPAYSVLSKDKIIKDFGIRIPKWRESLCLFIQTIAHKPELLSAWHIW